MLWLWSHYWTLSHYLMKVLLEAMLLYKHQLLYDAYIYVCVCVCIYIYTFVCVCVCIYIYIYIYVYIHTFVCVFVCIYVYVYIHTSMYVCMYVYIYIYKIRDLVEDQQSRIAWQTKWAEGRALPKLNWKPLDKKNEYNYRNNISRIYLETLQKLHMNQSQELLVNN